MLSNDNVSTKLPTDTLKTTLVKTHHKAPYSAISPLRPELSQTGKTVLIAGGSDGIGFAIARAFVQAKATRVIVTGRREAAINEAVAKLVAEANTTTTTVLGRIVDLNNLESTAQLFTSLATDDIFIDVLVLNAASVGPVAPILQAGLASVWPVFETNVRTLLDLTEHFYKQANPSQRKRYVVNVSTSAVHNLDSDAAVIPTYGLTKNAGTLLLQQIAKDIPAHAMQVVSFHPGGIYTETAQRNGVPADLYDWDAAELPGQFAVWAASDEAQFAHGRMLAAHWDADELKGEARKQMETDPRFLQIGVKGL
jgi:NAD(P)-dependent dehydrogenase (short-subunit alcohol dehydrogenase family)